MKILFISFFILFSFFGLAQHKVKKFNVDLGFSSYIPNYDQSSILYDANPFPTMGAYLGISFTAFKRFNIGVSGAFLRSSNDTYDEHSSKFNNLNTYSSQLTYYNRNTFYKLNLFYLFSPFHKLNFKMGICGGINKVFLFNQPSNLELKMDRTDLIGESNGTLDSIILAQIPTNSSSVYFIAPSVGLDIRLNNNIALAFGIDYRLFLENQFTYNIEEILINDKSEPNKLVDLKYIQFPVENINYTLGFKFKF